MGHAATKPHLHRVTNVTLRHLSPNEQNAFHGIFKDFGTKTVRKVSDNALSVGPALILGYGVYKWGNAEFAKRSHAHWD